MKPKVIPKYRSKCILCGEKILDNRERNIEKSLKFTNLDILGWIRIDSKLFIRNSNLAIMEVINDIKKIKSGEERRIKLGERYRCF